MINQALSGANAPVKLLIIQRQYLPSPGVKRRSHSRQIVNFIYVSVSVCYIYTVKTNFYIRN